MTRAEPADEQPTVYVIAGPNGAGKTTFARQFIPAAIRQPEFLNADLIAAGLAPFAPQTQAITAARLLLQRFHELSYLRRTFSFETTLSGRTYLAHLQKLRSHGYRIVATFLWLPSAEIAIERVAIRVKQGGHHVPEDDVRRRFAAGLHNFFTTYRPIFNEWALYNALHRPPQLIAQSVDSIEVVLQMDDFATCERQASKK